VPPGPNLKPPLLIDVGRQPERNPFWVSKACGRCIEIFDAFNWSRLDG